MHIHYLYIYVIYIYTCNNNIVCIAIGREEMRRPFSEMVGFNPHECQCVVSTRKTFIYFASLDSLEK